MKPPSQTAFAPTWSSRVASAWGLVALVRPFNLLVSAAGVVLGGFLVAGEAALSGEPGRRLLVAAVSAVLIGGAANALNDLFDLAIDRINRPGRPLPSGRIAPGWAKGVWATGSAVGLGLSLPLSAAHVAMALFSVGALYAYNAWLKRLGLVGNGLVAFILGLALVYGGWAVGSPEPALVGAAFAFLTTLAREIVKDIEDAEGDAQAGARTLPLVYGPQAASNVAALVVAVTLALIPLPFLVLGYSGLYLSGVLLASLLLLRALGLLMTRAPGEAASAASAALKGCMVLGLLALAAR